MVTYNPQHPDELDLLTEAVFAKWRQQCIWLAEIAQGESELRKSLPRADAKAHLANGIAKSEAVLKLYLRYDAQLHRHYRNCLKASEMACRSLLRTIRWRGSIGT